MSRPKQSLTVPDALRGARLFDVLVQALPDASHAALRQAVAAGGVRVNGMDELRNVRLRPGDYVEFDFDPGALAPAPHAASRRGAAPRPPDAAALPVLAETAHALVVAKPAGLPTVPDRSGRDRGLHGLLADLRPGDDLRIVHRLDRDTSGCVLLAKGLDAARHYDRAFRERQVHKRYVALVHGELLAAERTIDLFLGPDRRRPGLVVAAPRARTGFRDARTVARVRERLRGFTLVELEPATGRGHQLRVHLAAIGHPIVGDADYGGAPLLLSELKPGFKRRPGQQETPLLQRPFLHAASLRCTDVDGRELAAAAPLPDDLQQALDKVRRHRAARRRSRATDRPTDDGDPPCD